MYEGLNTGFHIGFSSRYIHPPSRVVNHPSSLANEQIVQERITSEKEAGRLLGPVPNHLKPLIHVSPLGLVPKSHQANKWRLIVDLSHPVGGSVNDGISPSLCSLRYASVDEAVSIVRKLGRGTRMAKLDIKDAYRIVPIHPDDYHLLGICWKGETYLDRALPFGLRSAPKIFNALADFVAWILHQHGIRYQLHYLDDFLLLGAPCSAEAQHCLEKAIQIFQDLGIPIALHKTEGPATVLIFLGILIDTEAFELRLPAEKLARLQETIGLWANKRACKRKDLESLLGHLSHAATVIPQGRTFLRQLFPLLALDRAPHHFVRLSAGARADLQWWKAFLQDWNGTSFFPALSPSIEVFSDASGSYGCGAFSTPYGWFQLEWPEIWQPFHITAKELLPIVLAAALWGGLWKRTCVCFKCDNMAVVDILTSHTSKDQLLMHLLRCLVFYAAFYGFSFIAEHVPGVTNTAADAISRDNISLFLSLVPQIPRMAVPQPVLDLLVTRRPNWGSNDWIRAFTSSLTREFQMPHGQPTSQDGGNIQSSATSSAFHPSHYRNTPSVSLSWPCPSQLAGEQSVHTSVQ